MRHVSFHTWNFLDFKPEFIVEWITPTVIFEFPTYLVLVYVFQVILVEGVPAAWLLDQLFYQNIAQLLLVPR